MVREYIGLARAKTPTTAHGHRWVAANITLPGWHTIVGISAYLVSGKKLGPENREILAEVGEYATTMSEPFCIGGDFQMNPGAIRRSLLPELCAAVVVSDASGLGTYRVSGDSAHDTNIDFSS